MTASPTVAQPMPGAEPIPGTDELPPDAAGPGAGTDEEDRRRRRKLLILLLLLLGFAILMGLAIWYLLFRQPIPIPVIPGETAMPSYLTSIYGPNRPMGVAVNAAGDRIYVGETEGDRIARVFDAAGNELALLRPPVSTGPDHVPVYLAVDPITTELYVTDRATGAVYVYDAAGTYQREFRPTIALNGWQPLGIAFDAAGNLYVSDVSVSPQVVLVFDRAGEQVRSLGESAGFSFPNGIAVDGDGNVYVTDGNNGRLIVMDPAGQMIAQIGRGVGEGNLGLPRGIAIDGRNQVYIGDATGQGVFVYGTVQPGERRLQYLGFFGTQGYADGQFQYPNGVAVDTRGRVYVTDSGNDRVQTWSY